VRHFGKPGGGNVRHRRPAARKTRRFAFVLIAAGALVAALATIAGAVVAPVGNITVTVTGAKFVIVLQGTPIDVGPFNGSFKGTVDATGKIAIPKAGVTFTTFAQTIQIPVTITPAATGPFTGTIDPSTGSLSLSGTLVTLASAASPALANCPIGPVKVVMLSTNYSATTGKATVADPAYQVPAIPPGAVGCGGIEGTINDTLGLPSTGGIIMPVTVSPILTGNGAPPPSTTTFTTTTSTTSTTVPTTVAPAPIATTALPRTGSSTGPLAFVGLSMLGAGLALAFRKRRSPLDT
jgi:LPXTG-motif cell wall-anchored protein